MTMGPVVAEIFLDFVCPYVYRAALWLDEVARRSSEPLSFRWRYFPLSQINNKQEGWKIWEQPLVNPAWNEVRTGRGLRAMWAHEAARQQGDSAAEAYRLALLRAVHEDGLSLNGAEATRAAAERAGLDLERWERDAHDPSLLDAIRRDYEVATGEYAIFGTPTFVFPGARPAYLKLDALVPASESLTYWADFRRVVADRSLVIEIKRPH